MLFGTSHKYDCLIQLCRIHLTLESFANLKGKHELFDLNGTVCKIITMYSVESSEREWIESMNVALLESVAGLTLPQHEDDEWEDEYLCADLHGFKSKANELIDEYQQSWLLSNYAPAKRFLAQYYAPLQLSLDNNFSDYSTGYYPMQLYFTLTRNPKKRKRQEDGKDKDNRQEKEATPMTLNKQNLQAFLKQVDISPLIRLIRDMGWNEQEPTLQCQRSICMHG